jgi:hypothetical protein
MRVTFHPQGLGIGLGKCMPDHLSRWTLVLGFRAQVKQMESAFEPEEGFRYRLLCARRGISMMPTAGRFQPATVRESCALWQSWSQPPGRLIAVKSSAIHKADAIRRRFPPVCAMHMWSIESGKE